MSKENDINLSMFRAYDIRTPSSSLGTELANRLDHAMAIYFKQDLGVNGVIVAHDARSSGPRYLQIGAEIFSNAGLDVIVIPGVCSTSMFYFTAMQYPEMAAVMFGASHNPAGDTGCKILGKGVIPIAEHIGPEGGLDKIKEYYIAGITASSKSCGSIRAYDPTEDYIAYSMELAGVRKGGLKGLMVLQDYLNGAAGREMMLAFTRADTDLSPLHFTADGSFPLGDPNPVKEEVIAEGIRTLKKGGSLLGVFFDGDGDRIDFYSGSGEYLSSSFVFAGILPEIRKRFPGDGIGVYADLKSNPLAIMEMAKTGVTVNVIRNGHSQIKNAMYENPAMVATVEESAHFYEAFTYQGARYCTENTLYIALLTARTWLENPRKYSELFEIQSETSRAREWGYKFPGDDHRAEALKDVEEYFKSLGANVMSRMPNGYDLEATMMRKGIPFDINENTKLSSDWLQVCQRISQSENGLARWEVVSGDPKLTAMAKEEIARIVKIHGAGDEYKG